MIRATLRATRSNLGRLWLAQFISRAGDQFFILAATFLVLQLSGSTTAAGLLGASQALPALVFGVFAGVLADRHDRRRLMILSDVARAVVIAAIPLLFFTGALSWWMLAAVAFAVSSFSIVFEPARDALLPSLAGGSSLARANSLFQTSMPLATITGCMLVGALGLATAGLDDEATLATARSTDTANLIWLIVADGATFVVSALLIWRIRTAASAHPSAAAPHTTAPSRPRFADQLRETGTLLRTDGRLRALLIITAANNLFLMGPATVGAAIMFQREMHRGADAFGYFGIFEATMSAGLLVGLFWMLWKGRSWPKGKMLIAGLLLDGITYVPFLWFTPDTPFELYLALIGFHGFFIPWIVVSRTAMVQEYWPSAVQGRIFALVALTVTGFHALSALVTGWAAEYLSAYELYAIGGGGAALMGLFALFAPSLRSAR